MAGAVPLSVEPVAVDAVVRQIGERAIEGEGIELDLDRVEVPGSARLLRIAVVNLVRNAFRHGDGADGTVVVTVDQRGVTVSDEGPGIPEEQLAQVIRDLPQGLRRDRTGRMGIALAAWVADAHGGWLEIDNRPEGGLKVSLRLPVRPRGGEAA